MTARGLVAATTMRITTIVLVVAAATMTMTIMMTAVDNP